MLRSIILPSILSLFKTVEQEKFVPFSLLLRPHFRAIFALAIIIFAAMPANAQWGFVPNSFPPTELHNGLAGIGRFSPLPAAPSLVPARMLHIHSENFGVSTTTVYQPAFLRLQSQSQNFGPNSNVNYFGQTGIEFFSGSNQNNGAGGWCVGKILGITNGLGINPNLPTPLFQPNGPVEIGLRGGLAFFCSMSKSAGLPMETNREVMRIVDGMVGIGTTKPKEMLQIYEKMTFHVGGNDYYMGYNQNSIVESGSLVIRRFWNNPTEEMAIDADYSPLTDGVAPGEKQAAIDMSDGTITLMIGIASRMQQDAAISQTTMLSAAKDGKSTIGTHTDSGTRAVNTSANGKLRTTSEPSGWPLNGNDIGDHDYIGVNNNKPFIFKTNNEHHMLIAANGDLHVGTLQWDYSATACNLDRTVYPSLLTVNGAMVAKLVRVTVNHWADNVFSPGYRLMPLTEVREYIDKHGHLPDVPAEAEATKNGVDLQEMQAVLLRKVEELTLHLIKIEEENKKLRSRVDAINASLPMEGE